MTQLDQRTAGWSRALDDLVDAAPGWATTPPDQVADLVAATRATVAAVAAEWAEAAARAKGLTLGTPAVSEEWQSGPWSILRNLRLLEASLRDLAAGRRPSISGEVTVNEFGRAAVPAFPFDRWDHLLFPGVRAKIWMQPGLTPAEVIERQALAYTSPPPGRVELVLGAGNITSIAPMDALYQLVVERKTVILKTSPVVDYLTPILRSALRPLVEAGVLRIVSGDGTLGRRIVEDTRVSGVHVTGSDETYERIVFGVTGTEADLSGRSPVIDKPVTAELGSITPVIVVPGPWSERDIGYQAENLAITLAHNAGFNCIASRLFIQHAGWPLQSRLVGEIQRVLANIPARRPYYPGAVERYQRFLAGHEHVDRLGSGDIPWTLIRDLDPDSDDLCLRREVFAAVAATIELTAPDPVAFLARAVEFCNERVWGNLGASIFIHPRTAADKRMRKALRAALRDLRYGTVAINAWSGFGYAMSSTPWGAYPGNPPHHIQSGTGHVHNTLMLDGAEKTVVRSPWRTFPKPTWFPSHRNAHRVLEATTFLEAEPGLARFVRVAARSLGA